MAIYVKVLVENGADVNAQDPFGWTSLYNAIYHENMSMVKILANENTNLELRSFEFGTPLHYLTENKKSLHDSTKCMCWSYN